MSARVIAGSSKTKNGEISARSLIVATNAYTGEFSKQLSPGIASEVMPVLSWQMATQPLSDEARKTIIPGRQSMSDTHGELYFARYDARNRLVTGGNVVGLGDKTERLKVMVAERLKRLWPQIGDVQFDYVWNGYVGMTTDFLPRMHKLGPNAYGWTGCNGRGVALSVALGDEFVEGGARRAGERAGAAILRAGADCGAWAHAIARALHAAGLSAAGMRRRWLSVRHTLSPHPEEPRSGVLEGWARARNLAISWFETRASARSSP